MALAAALSYGVSDFVGGIASRRVAALRVVIVSYPVGLVLLFILASVIGGEISVVAALWGALAGIAGAFGVWWFYAALGSGPISVVSPLTSILVAGIPLCVGLAMGERPGWIAAVGAALALVAVTLVSRQKDDHSEGFRSFTKKVAWLTVGSGTAFALNFVINHQFPVEAKLWPLVFGRLAATVLLVGVAAAAGQLRLPGGFPLRMALLAAVLDTSANVFTLLALQASMLSLAAVLIALYPAATVGLAIVVLREKVTRWQMVGMASALTSIALLAAA